MTTLIITSNGRCDARCYEAKGGNCTCPCGGMNHGQGLLTAESNTRRNAERLQLEHNAKFKIDVKQVSIFDFLEVCQT